MKIKWYWSTCVAILALVGFSLQQFSVPNQEIVVQFSTHEVAEQKATNTLAVVTKQLQTLGAENIQVYSQENGNLKITYYSDLEVAFIKNILAKEEALSLGYSSILKDHTSSDLPNPNPENPFKLDVFEIKQGEDKKGDFNSLALELKPEIDRFFKTVVYFSVLNSAEKERDRIEKVAYTSQYTVAVAIDNTSYIIPDVRAGPRIV